jgi:sensor histidine kinase YesM
MFDKIRLFKVLYFLSIEESLFLVAQDAYKAIRSSIDQINDMDVTMANLIQDLHTAEANQKNVLQETIDTLTAFSVDKMLWINLLNPLLEASGKYTFYCCD